MSDTYLGLNLDQELFQKYEELSQQTGRTLPELVQDALSYYLTVKSDSVSVSISKLNQEIISLKQRVIDLESTQGRFNALSLKIQVLEHKVNQRLSSEQPINPPASIQPVKTVEINSGSEDEEDEPDEILWDFMTE